MCPRASSRRIVRSLSTIAGSILAASRAASLPQRERGAKRSTESSQKVAGPSLTRDTCIIS